MSESLGLNDVNISLSHSNFIPNNKLFINDDTQNPYLKIKVYEGIEGLKNAINYIYEFLVPLTPITRIFGLDRKVYSQYFGDEYMIGCYRKVDKTKDFLIRCLVNYENDDYMIEERRYITEDKKIPDKYINNITTYILYNRIIYVNWYNLRAIEIENDVISKLHKGQFDLIWDEIAR